MNWILKTTLILTVLIGLALPSHAATISWSSKALVNEGTAKVYMGTGQVDSTGTKVVAANIGGPATSYDGIDYTTASIAGLDSTYSGYHANNANTEVSRYGAYDTSVGVKTVTLGAGGIGAVVPGVTYRIQLLFMDGRIDRNGCIVKVDGVNRGVYANAVSGSTYGDGLLVTGTFTADADSQSFTIEIFEADPSLLPQASIVGLDVVSNTMIRMVVDAPDSEASYAPVKNVDLTEGTWANAAHSPDGVAPFVVTNFTYSSSDGTNEVIYLRVDETEGFFGVGAFSRGGQLNALALYEVADIPGAAAITWSSTAFINEGADKSYMGTGQIDTTGTEVLAANIGGPATTFDGITYAAGSVDSLGSTASDYHADNANAQVSRYGAYDSFSGAKTVTLGAGGIGTIVPGTTYRVQLLFMDGRGAQNGQTVEVDGVNRGVYANGIDGSTYGDGLLVTGTFTATTDSKSFAIELFDGSISKGGQLNALLLHSVLPSTIPVVNGDFELGSTDTDATSWFEPAGSVYFKAAQGFYNGFYHIEYPNAPETIEGRAASFESTGSAYIYQELAGVYADTYDTYEIDFDLGYRCDLVRGGHIDAFRVSLWDPVTSREVAGENMVIGQPWVLNDQSPNVSTLVSRRVILQVDSVDQPHNPLLLCFRNLHTESIPSDAVAVLDNVSAAGFRRVAHWEFENDLMDEMGNHDGASLPGEGSSWGSPGVDGGYYGHLNTSSNICGAFVPGSDLFSDGESFSVSAWVFLPAWSNWDNYQSVISYRCNTTGHAGFSLYATADNQWSFWTGRENDWFGLDDPASIVAGQWNYVVGTFEQTGTYDADEVLGIKRLYVNGKLVATEGAECYRHHVDSGIPVKLGVGGTVATATQYKLDGYLDRVKFIDRCLTSGEISEVYADYVDRLNPDNSGSAFRVMTYNIKAGLESDIATVGQIIANSDADVVGIQEVKASQVATLAAEAGMPYYTFGYASESYGGFGNAILSKVPFISENNYALYQYDIEETRACQVVTVLIEGKTYTIANTHLTHSTPFENSMTAHKVRARQADDILNSLNSTKGRIILMGDLNSRTYHPGVDNLRQSFVDAWDIATTKGVGEGGYVGSPYDRDRIDHIMMSHNHWEDEVAYISMLVTAGSDHYPIYADILSQ